VEGMGRRGGYGFPREVGECGARPAGGPGVRVAQKSMEQAR
jgi:hypothetical protein